MEHLDLIFVKTIHDLFFNESITVMDFIIYDLIF